MGEGAYGVDDEVYIEQGFSSAEFDQLEEIDFTWEGRDYRIPRPEKQGDVHYVVVEGTDLFLQIGLIEHASWRRRLKGALTPNSEPPIVLESRAQARRVAPPGDA